MDELLLGVMLGAVVVTPVAGCQGHSNGLRDAKDHHAVEVSWPERAVVDGKENVSYQYDRAKWEPMGLIGDTLILKRKSKP